MTGNRLEVTRLVERLPVLEPCRSSILSATDLTIDVLRGGGTLFTCGNGGSAADAEHMVGELVKSFERPRPIDPALRDGLVDRFGADGASIAARLQSGLRAVSLVSSVAAASAISNDQGADLVFAQQLVALARPGDLLIAFSTSGTASNVVAALRVALVLGLRRVLFTGSRSPQSVREMVDQAIVVPESRTADIQERHLAIYHAMCVDMETSFFG